MPVLRNAIAATERLLASSQSGFGKSILAIAAVQPQRMSYDETRRELIIPFKVNKGVCNGVGSLHGGAAATLADLCTTIHLLGERPSWQHVSGSLELMYLSASGPDQELHGVSRVLRYGGNVAFTEFEIRSPQTGNVLMKASHMKIVTSRGIDTKGR